MERRLLGKSDLRVSEIGFGCMSLAGDDEHDINLLRRALELGVNFVDTADLYQQGRNEKIVGRALAKNRPRCIIATKVGNQWRSDGSGWDWNPRKEYILSAVDKSLKNLRTDYIDLYQLHGGTIEDPIDETIDAFEKLKQAGKIRHYGISSIRPNTIREYVKKSSITSVMMQYSLLDQRPAESCFSLLLENQVSVLARGVLARGLLSGKPPTSYLSYDEASVKKIQDQIRRFATEDETETSIAIRWALRQPVIASAVIGIRTSEQLQAAVGAGTAKPVSKQQLDELDLVLPPNYYDAHR